MSTLSTRALLSEFMNNHGGAVPSLEEARARPGCITEIEEETYFQYLEVLPPQLMLGSVFCFAEGAEPHLLFWSANGLYYARQLTWDETRRLCEAAGLPLPGNW